MTRPANRAVIVTSATLPRNICAVGSPTTHDAFAEIARKAGVTKAEFLKRMIEAKVKE